MCIAEQTIQQEFKKKYLQCTTMGPIISGLISFRTVSTNLSILSVEAGIPMSGHSK